MSLSATTVAAPQPLVCVIAHLHRDLAVADEVCRGRFTHAGVTLELGVEPDWLGAELPHDEEWQIEWSKLYVGLDLAHAYATTGDTRYAETWARLVGSWIAQVPVDRDSSDVAARRVQNFVYAWSGFTSAPVPFAFDELFLRRLSASIAEHCTRIGDDLTAERNHRTLELYALLVCALALPALDPDGTLRAFAVAELEANLLTDFLPDGVQREASTHYHLIALRSHLGALANYRLHRIVPSPAFVDRLHRALDFALHCHRPDGEIPMTSDSDGGSYADVLALGAELLGRDDLRWAATLGREGRAPVVTAADFPHGGYHVQRSGWGDAGTAYADERFLLLDCGPVGDGGHGHYDALSIEAYGGGRPLVVDPGRFTYDEGAEGEPNWRRWFKGTAAHNTVTVDGLDQLAYRRGKPKGALYLTRLAGRVQAPGLDVLRGTVESPCHDAVHERTVAFVDGRLWIVVDRLAAPTAHTYDLRFHLTSEAQGRVTQTEHEGHVAVEAPGLALLLPAPAPIVVEDGWVAPLYGIRHAAPVMSLRTGPVAEARFVTALVPLADGEAPPHLRLLEAPAHTALELLWDDGTVDALGWATADPIGARPTAALLHTRTGARA